LSIRVTAGVARGRQLQIPRTDLRPTTDKVKQAMFSMLEAEAQRRGFEGDEDRFAAMQAWPRVLDLYAGSGALGIEALSRGAARATFVERDRTAIETIRQNLEKTGLEARADVRRAGALAGLSTLTGTCDLILLDPPYREIGLALKTLERIQACQLLADQGLIVWEHQTSALALTPPKGLRWARRREHGSTSIALIEREPGLERDDGDGGQGREDSSPP
jgi:16S rRNA (guanine966-N2)-methyltransferase